VRKTRAGARDGLKRHTPLTQAAAAKIAGRSAAELVLKKRCNIDLMFPALFGVRNPAASSRSETPVSKPGF
jgi:hypothetical protein